MNPYQSVSLFSGAMGFDLGLEMSGQFRTIAAVEQDSACCRTIRRNQKAGLIGSSSMRVYEGDIRQVDPHRIMCVTNLAAGQLDLLTAGPPCQSFSTTGRRRTVQDPRGTLLWRTIDYIEAFQPKCFVIENVRGLLSAALRHRPLVSRPENGGPALLPEEEPGSVIRQFLLDVRERLGTCYRMDVFEVNAVNYGSCQLRERAIFIGNRLGAQVDFPVPTHGDAGVPYATLGEALATVSDDSSPIMDFSPRKKSYLRLIPPGGNWRCLPESLQRESMGKAFFAKGGRSGWWRRLSADLPCPTIVTMPNHASTALTHPGEVRALTVRECAAVQGFPTNWQFAGTPQEQYAQVGNAVPIRLGLVASEAIVGCLKSGHMLESVPNNEFPPYRLVYLKSHVRTRQWFKAGEKIIWRDGEANAKAQYAAPVTLRKEREFVHA